MEGFRTRYNAIRINTNLKLIQCMTHKMVHINENAIDTSQNKENDKIPIIDMV